MELKKHFDIKTVFQKLDEDGSNCLEIDELDLMFKQNGIPIKQKQLENLFKIIDEDGGGSLDLEEFKQLTLSEEANLFYRRII